MPKVLQARKAREKADKALLGMLGFDYVLKSSRVNILLARVLDKWVKAYRTKIALKAVA